ncbi:D-alanyl-D-alanine carboxypeptidase [Candidatus Saccharibacteria bacterium]|nr:D-alanyl-D-alanine carboxypeptidase [Candidatus Saccharibacteria bacterium]
MRVIEPRLLHSKAQRKKKRLNKFSIFFILLIISAFSFGSYGYWRINLPLPDPSVTTAEPKYAAKTATFNWPEQSHAAVGAVGMGVLGQSSDDETPLPTASVAKIITALTVLEHKPLDLGEAGAVITPTIEDEAIYDKYITVNGSVSGITTGVSFSQYQALQALLLPSSNNMSETLTNWAFGSQQEYLKAANEYVKSKGLMHTTVADSSGFLADTKSTPSDLVRLGELALTNPVIAQIIQQRSADIPGAGTVVNTNRLLGQSDINGIKTGNTDEAGGCFLVSSTHRYENGKAVTVVVAIMSAPTITDAMNQSKPLLTQVKDGFGDVQVATAGQQFGHIDTAWSDKSAIIIAKNDLTMFGWRYATPQAIINLTNKQYDAGSTIGEAVIKLGTEQSNVDLIQQGDLQSPTKLWLLLRNKKQVKG